MNEQNKQRPTTLNFKTTYLSDVGIKTLLTHALSLPSGHPARETIKLMAQRWTHEGREVAFVSALKGGPDLELEVVDPFDGLEDVMQEAA